MRINVSARIIVLYNVCDIIQSACWWCFRDKYMTSIVVFSFCDDVLRDSIDDDMVSSRYSIVFCSITAAVLWWWWCYCFQMCDMYYCLKGHCLVAFSIVCVFLDDVFVFCVVVWRALSQLFGKLLIIMKTSHWCFVLFNKISFPVASCWHSCYSYSVKMMIWFDKINYSIIGDNDNVLFLFQYDDI